ncbi:CG31360 [Drosophila busckii]|uniref:CG31360 n=1 Tax=Drosophila busckii TaxID=30019 RepID=A0A0M4ED93_DROBS|nr:CG31360 [Drosophila busckii]
MIGKLASWYRENVSESADCVACRLISGFGMMGIGGFILSQAKRRRSPLESITMKSIAAGVQIMPLGLIVYKTLNNNFLLTVAGFLGVARLADANFLKAKAEPAKEQIKPKAEHPFFKR